MDDDTKHGWLIETNPGKPATWLKNIGGIGVFTADSNTAIRFSRQSDAEDVIALLHLHGCRATDHMWINHDFSKETP